MKTNRKKSRIGIAYDMLYRPVSVGDFCIYYNKICKILSIRFYGLDSYNNNAEIYQCHLKQVHSDHGWDEIDEMSDHICKLEKEDILAWKLKLNS